MQPQHLRDHQREVSAEHHEVAVRDIDQAHDAEGERKAEAVNV